MTARMIACSAVVIAALGPSACGGSSDEDDVKGLAKQVANSDQKVCDHATGNFLKAVGGTKEKCRQAARAGSKQPKPDVGKVTVDGDTATAVIKNGRSKATLQFTKSDGDWQIASVR